MKKRILVLEDNPDILDIVKEVLSYEDYEVKGTQRVKEACIAAHEFRPHLLIADYRLADGNGGEVIRKFKADEAYAGLKTILFSAYSSPDFNYSVYGADAFIAKPFDMYELVDQVKQLVG